MRRNLAAHALIVRPGTRRLRDNVRDHRVICFWLSRGSGSCRESCATRTGNTHDPLPIIVHDAVSAASGSTNSITPSSDAMREATRAGSL